MKKVFIRTLLLFCVGILTLFAIGTLIVANSVNKSAAKDNAANLLGLFEDQMIDGKCGAPDETISYQALVTILGEVKDIRVTVIATDGTVLADTGLNNPSSAENHSGRKEVIAALNGGTGTDIRKSATLNIDFLYMAKRVTVTGASSVVLRVAVPIQSINAYLYWTLFITAIIFVVILIAVIIVSRYAADRINKPFVLVKNKLSDVLNPKSEPKPIVLTKHDDINEMLSEIDGISEKLGATLVYKQEFFTNAGHELNTPLSSILGYSEMMLNEKQYNQKFIETIHNEAARMKLLIDDMLTISELEENKEIKDEKIGLRLIAEQVITAATPKAKSKSVTLTAYLESCEIVANAEKITEVIANLVDNAIKYTNTNGRVIVSLKSENGKAILSVKDTGIGIPQKDQARVFERFYRVDKGRSRTEGSTGLGLAIVKHICNHYNAPIKLQSKEGVGTEITIVFECTN